MGWALSIIHPVRPDGPRRGADAAPRPVVLTNRDADLVDINAAGLPDLVYTPENGHHRFYLNRGHGRWQAEPLLPESSPAERLSNPNVRMAPTGGCVMP